jgi:endonuclease/exonuclease/phosphatase family metal-dependent hydrolase
MRVGLLLFSKNVLFRLLVGCLMALPAGGDSGDAVLLFSYTELTALYSDKRASPEIEAKLNRLLTVPFVNTNVSTNKPIPLARSEQLGEFVRVAHWNIERGLEYEALEAAFDSEEKLIALLDPQEFPAGSDARKQILEQASLLRGADVIVLNEVDWGLKRSGYRNVVAELASRFSLNYAFGVEFIELTPVHLSQKKDLPDGKTDEITEILKLDEERYKGLHGTAILSRFPLDNVRLIPFKSQPYDWFEGEKKGVSFVEKAKRKLVKEVFLAEALSEVRRGGRTMLIADITDPRLPAGRATVVATHLESRTSPANRQIQLKELLDTIKPIRNPVIVAGDMNTSSSDTTPTSVGRELGKRFGKPEYWLKTGLNYLLGVGMIQDAAIASLTFGRNHGDPTVRHIPIIMPNDERKFFSLLKEFRFADGGAIDFRGESSRSAGGKRNTLANSNERDEKGFITTFRLKRPVKFIGRYKLDWIFVKPVLLFDASDYQGSYVFAPHFGRTLGAVNSISKNRISDHSPMIVDLPLAEPSIEKQKRKK